jgi:OmpA-OmpF porin, OOP family
MGKIPVIGLAFLSILWPFAAIAQEEGWDFVPGEKLLLFDDFTDMPKGAAPPHWKVRGAAVRLVDGRLTIAASAETRMTPNITKWPDNFTIEMNVQALPPDEDSMRVITWEFNRGDSFVGQSSLTLHGGGGGDVYVDAGDEDKQRVEFSWRKGEPNGYAIWFQDGRLRVYLNGKRLVDLNQLKLSFDNARLMLSGDALPVSFGAFRIAQSVPDISKTILSSGRYVTHGIQFDVNNATLKPESRPVLQQIAEALAAAPNLKVRIEGHTDSTGEPAKNLDLSKRRAESVKKALVEQFKIPADRLTTDGFGDTKPAAANDTPQGRAENRRVEFVKI